MNPKVEMKRLLWAGQWSEKTMKWVRENYNWMPNWLLKIVLSGIMMIFKMLLGKTT